MVGDCRAENRQVYPIGESIRWHQPGIFIGERLRLSQLPAERQSDSGSSQRRGCASNGQAAIGILPDELAVAGERIRLYIACRITCRGFFVIKALKKFDPLRPKLPVVRVVAASYFTCRSEDAM
jgi:hypothetical protein